MCPRRREFESLTRYQSKEYAVVNDTLLILIVVAAHWVGDFVLQTQWMAENKSKSVAVLSTHVAVYTCVMMWAVATFTMTTSLRVEDVLAWVTLNGALHLIVDSVTSVASSHFWYKREYRKFFMVVGFDQCVHYVCLIGTLGMMTGTEG